MKTLTPYTPYNQNYFKYFHRLPKIIEMQKYKKPRPMYDLYKMFVTLHFPVDRIIRECKNLCESVKNLALCSVFNILHDQIYYNWQTKKFTFKSNHTKTCFNFCKKNFETNITSWLCLSFDQYVYFFILTH